jgi:hypothetical protein
MAIARIGAFSGRRTTASAADRRVREHRHRPVGVSGLPHDAARRAIRVLAGTQDAIGMRPSANVGS